MRLSSKNTGGEGAAAGGVGTVEPPTVEGPAVGQVCAEPWCSARAMAQDATGGATTLGSGLAPRRRSLSPSLPLLPNRTKAAVLILSLEPSSLKVSLQLPSLTKLYLLQPPPPCIGYAELPMSSCYNNGGRRPLLPSPFSTFRPSKTGLGLHGDPTPTFTSPLAVPSTIDLSFKSSAMADNVWSSSNESMCQAPDLFLNSNILLARPKH